MFNPFMLYFKGQSTSGRLRKLVVSLEIQDSVVQMCAESLNHHFIIAVLSIFFLCGHTSNIHIKTYSCAIANRIHMLVRVVI